MNRRPGCLIVTFQNKSIANQGVCVGVRAHMYQLPPPPPLLGGCPHDVTSTQPRAPRPWLQLIKLDNEISQGNRKPAPK